MSDLTQCNYCRLQSIRRDAKKKEKRVVIKPVGLGEWNRLGGYNVYLLDKGEKLTAKNRVSWMMEITETCQC